MSIVDDYKKLVKGFKTTQSLKEIFPSPSEEDYRKGYITRFFAQLANDKNSPVYEINANTFTRISQQPDYTTVSIRWRITGSLEKEFDNDNNIIDFGVRESNKRALKLNFNVMPALKYRIVNYLQFYKK
jgi:hypothetical protein